MKTDCRPDGPKAADRAMRRLKKLAKRVRREVNRPRRHTRIIGREARLATATGLGGLVLGLILANWATLTGRH